MKQLEFVQFLPISPAEAWNFFSNPANLDRITPAKLKFKTLTEVPAIITDGLIIRYKIRPMLSIPVSWTTRIKDIRENVLFIDEQIKGPYKSWKHEHHFREVENGVMMTDRLSYDIGLGVIGKIAGYMWVDKKVKEIFTYRQRKLAELFPG